MESFCDGPPYSPSHYHIETSASNTNQNAS